MSYIETRINQVQLIRDMAEISQMNFKRNLSCISANMVVVSTGRQTGQTTGLIEYLNTVTHPVTVIGGTMSAMHDVRCSVSNKIRGRGHDFTSVGHVTQKLLPSVIFTDVSLRICHKTLATELAHLHPEGGFNYVLVLNPY